MFCRSSAVVDVWFVQPGADGSNGGGGGSSANGASKGLSERELSLMPIEIGTGSGSTEQCCICMEEMKPTDVVTRLPACTHVYHR